MKTFAGYMDSTPDLRRRRDAMLAMCDEIQENIRGPWERFADADGFLTFTGRRNAVTGGMIGVAHVIHKDDVDWYERLWQDVDLLGCKVTLARLAAGAA